MLPSNLKSKSPEIPPVGAHRAPPRPEEPKPAPRGELPFRDALTILSGGYIWGSPLSDGEPQRPALWLAVDRAANARQLLDLIGHRGPIHWADYVENCPACHLLYTRKT